ncbi:hypothetical protein [Methylovulum psychrotolerans]|nr:hypothetical protein [Methylovulum psychrotolerans]
MTVTTFNTLPQAYRADSNPKRAPVTPLSVVLSTPIKNPNLGQEKSL